MLRHFWTLCGVSRFLVAIGNEENDVSLLQKADLAFVIRNPGRGPHPALTAIPHASCSTRSCSTRKGQEDGWKC